MKNVFSTLAVGLCLMGFSTVFGEDSFDRLPPAEVKEILNKTEIHGLVQAWYVSSQETTDQFKLRRGEIQLKGHVTDNVEFFVMIDPTKSVSENKTVGGTTVRQLKKDGNILQDLGVTLRVLKNMKLSMGQLKRPIGFEGLQSSSQLELQERAIVSRELSDKRDIGATVQGDVASLKVEYIVGVFNGEGPNTSDTNDKKDVAGILIFKPNPGVKFYISAYEGSQGVQNDVQRREGVGVQVENGPVLLRSEFLEGKDLNVEKQGWYVLGMFRLNALGLETLDPLRVAARYEEWDADESDAAEVHIVSVGTQYFFDEKGFTKFGLDYFYSDSKGSEGDDKGLSFGYQVKF